MKPHTILGGLSLGCILGAFIVADEGEALLCAIAAVLLAGTGALIAWRPR